MLGANAAVACCDNNVGLDFEGGMQIGDSVADVKVMQMPRRSTRATPGSGGFLQRVQDAVQEAVHPGSVNGGDTGSSGSDAFNIDGGGSYASSAQVIPFPVVSPYRPLTATRVPIEGLTAFPKSGYYFNGEPLVDFNLEGDSGPERVPPGHESLGFVDPIMSAPSGIGLGRSYSPLGMQWEGVIGQITQTIPGIISATKGQPYYDPSSATNPQLFPTTTGTAQRQPPEGYYYDQSGSLRQIGSAVGGAAGDIGQSLSNFVQSNPLLILGGGLALVLLFMRPPGKR